MLWTIIEKAATQVTSEEKEDQASLEDFVRLIKQSVMLLGQTKNKVACFLRLNILNVSLSSKSDNISVELAPLEKLEHSYPLLKKMFPEELKQNVPLG